MAPTEEMSDSEESPETAVAVEESESAVVHHQEAFAEESVVSEEMPDTSVEAEDEESSAVVHLREVLACRSTSDGFTLLNLYRIHFLVVAILRCTTIVL